MIIALTEKGSSKMTNKEFTQIATRLATASKMVIQSNLYELSKNIEYMQECLDEYNKAYKKLLENENE